MLTDLIVFLQQIIMSASNVREKCTSIGNSNKKVHFYVLNYFSVLSNVSSSKDNG